MPVYLDCESIRGDVTAKSYEGFVKLDSAKFDLAHLVDESPSGEKTIKQLKASHFVVTKEMDSSAASLLNSVVKINTDIVRVVFLSVSPATGADVKFLEYELAGCRVIDYAMEADVEGKVMETISFFYEKLTLKYTGRSVGGISSGREVAVYDRRVD